MPHSARTPYYSLAPRRSQVADPLRYLVTAPGPRLAPALVTALPPTRPVFSHRPPMPLRRATNGAARPGTAAPSQLPE